MPSNVALSPGDHAVHFYAGDAHLVPTVLAQLVSALDAGTPVVVVATAEHRTAFETGLRAREVDVAAAESAALLAWRDATEIAARVVVDGTVDPDAFEAVVGSLIRAAAADCGAVHVYGEIVAVLWARGEVVAAIELEQLWNAMIAELPISLLCGYPIGLMTTGDHIADFPAVCAEHTRLLGGAPVASPAGVSSRFPCAALAVRHARVFVADTLCSWQRADLVDSAALVVTELATNAVRYAGSDFTVSLVRRDNVIRVAVGDSRPVAPTPRESGIDEPRGRGLVLVGGMSARWGHDIVADGKLVWAEFVDEPRLAAL
jgi:anti-sigma regulatory factor (Ser/Thr protein kinase)